MAECPNRQSRGKKPRIRAICVFRITGLRLQQGYYESNSSQAALPPNPGHGAQHKVKKVNVSSLLMFFALFAVIALSLAAGVGLGYAVIFGILNAFDRSRRSMQAAPAQVLNTSLGAD